MYATPPVPRHLRIEIADGIYHVINRANHRSDIFTKTNDFEAFENIPVLIKLWKADAEFAADANMYFDASIKNIFCTEDIVVLAGFIAASL